VIALATVIALAPAALQTAFEDVSSRSGLNAVLRNAATPEKHQIETMAGGIAVIDFDNDGHPDLFLTNGVPQPGCRFTFISTLWSIQA